MVLDYVAEGVLVVLDLDMALALVGCKVITAVVDRLMRVVSSELKCRGGASEKGKIEDGHLN